MKILKKSKWSKFCKFFQGKKRNIGIIIGFLLKGVASKYPDLITIEVYQIIEWVIDIFLVGAMADAVTPDDVVSSAIKKVTNKLITIKK